MNKNHFLDHAPMGWNSYDYYDTNVTEEDVLRNARFMAEHLKPYGWEYVVIDIQWYAYHTASMRQRFQYIPFGKNEMDAFGRLLPCPDKFPSSADGKGFGPLANAIHALGLKFGIHIMRGIPRIAAHMHLPVLGAKETADMIADPSSICPWNPDMYGVRNTPDGQAYYDSLMELYASWGVDFIKCDDICATGFGPERTYNERHEVEMIHKAIEKCGRNIVLSLSPGPALIEHSWHYAKYANMWRITDDFWDNWNTLQDMFCRCEKWQDHVSQGCYPDCDMLPLGKVGKHFGYERDSLFTKEEQKTMMALWCIFGSPLMLGADMPQLDSWTLSLLQNKKLLHLHNGNFVSKQILRDDVKCIWAATDPNTKECYVALFNFDDQPKDIAIDCKTCGSMFTDESFTVDWDAMEEVFTNEIYYSAAGIVGGNVPGHGTLLLHSIKIKR